MPDPALRASTWVSRLWPTGLQARMPLSLMIALAVATGGAWLLTIYQAVSMNMPMGIAVRGGASVEGMEGMADMEGMAGMAMGGIAATGWSFWNAVVFVAVWTVMMAAMMLPAAAPMIFMFAAAQGRRERERAVPTLIFVAGYILVWAAAGILVYVLVEIGSDLAAGLAQAERAKWGPLALGITLAAAGLYQFTPVKRVCLTHCRSPFAFIAQHWRDGRIGALTMGIRHGLYCFGCCWALFAILVAAGVMSMAWMLLLTLVVFVEKVLPQGRHAAGVIGIALIGFGIVVASGTVAMPWIA